LPSKPQKTQDAIGQLCKQLAKARAVMLYVPECEQHPQPMTRCGTRLHAIGASETNAVLAGLRLTRANLADDKATPDIGVHHLSNFD